MIKLLKEKFHFKKIIMVGDGATDMEACPPAVCINGANFFPGCTFSLSLFPSFFLSSKTILLCRPGWSAVAQSQLTATSVICLPRPPKVLGLQA